MTNPPENDFVPLPLFYAYAREDEGLRSKLEKHLTSLKHQKIITTWWDQQIKPGGNWSKEIQAHLNEASIILLLISADFLSSRYCHSVEMERALERHRHGDAHVIPIILCPTIWKDERSLGQLQALPADAKAVTEGIQRVAEELLAEAKAKKKSGAPGEKPTNIGEKPEEIKPGLGGLRDVTNPSTGDYLPLKESQQAPLPPKVANRRKGALLAGLVLLVVLGSTLTAFIVKWQSIAILPMATATVPLSLTVIGATHPSPASEPTSTAPALSLSNWLKGFCRNVVAPDYTSAYSKMTGNPLKYRVLDGSTYIQCAPTYIHQISSVSTHIILQMTTNDGANPYYRYIIVMGSSGSNWKISEWFTTPQPNW